MRMSVFVFAATVLAASGAAAQEYPKLKAGQWDLTMSSARAGANAAPTKSTMCTDDAVQKEMTTMGAGMSREMCTKNEFRRDGSRYVGQSECKIGDSKMVARTVMTLTGDSGYRTVIDATYDPPFMGMKEAQTVIEARHVGACRDGLVPGDFITPGGQKVNLKGIGAARPPAPSTQPARTPKVSQ
jgi:Protein of unknown function (DUF3617)